jgi:hypothetical protein
VGNAGGTVDVFGGHLLQQLSHAGGAAGALQARRARCIEAGGMYRHAAGVIAPVFKPLKALDEDGNDVARRYRADDAAHGVCPWVGFDGADRKQHREKLSIDISMKLNLNFTKHNA